METISNETKAKEFANYFVGETDYKESDAYSASISMTEWREQQLIDKANKKGAAYSAAMAMAQWKDEQHEQEKQQWIDKAMKVICNGCAQKVECEFNNWKTCNTKDELIKSIGE